MQRIVVGVYVSDQLRLVAHAAQQRAHSDGMVVYDLMCADFDLHIFCLKTSDCKNSKISSLKYPVNANHSIAILQLWERPDMRHLFFVCGICVTIDDSCGLVLGLLFGGEGEKVFVRGTSSITQ